MKRFLLFAGDTYYPKGGINDFVKDFTSLNEAKEAAKGFSNDSFEWYHIYDTKTKTKIDLKSLWQTQQPKQ